MAVPFVTPSFKPAEIQGSRKYPMLMIFFLDIQLVASYGHSKDCREGSVGREEFVQVSLV